MNLADLREDYTQGGINRASMKPNPFEQFKEWLKVCLLYTSDAADE